MPRKSLKNRSCSKNFRKKGSCKKSHKNKRVGKNRRMRGGDGQVELSGTKPTPAPTPAPAETGGIFGFFRNLFKGNPKTQSDCDSKKQEYENCLDVVNKKGTGEQS
jgi:hypothetical protein